MFREKQYFSGVIFSHPLLKDEDVAISKILGPRFEAFETVGHLDLFTVSHLHYVSPEPLHRQSQEEAVNLGRIRTRPIDGKRHYLYDCYLIKFSGPSKTPLFFFASPLKKILKDNIDSKARTLGSESLMYHFINISSLCDYLEVPDHSPFINLTRINFQTASTASGLKNFAFYGDHVVNSRPYKIMKDFGHPSSIRLAIQGEEQSLAINTDRWGNWSFYLKQQKDIIFIHDIFNLFQNTNLFGHTFNDPRKRISSQDEI